MLLTSTLFFLFIMYLFFSDFTEDMVIKKNSFDYFTSLSSKVREIPVERWGTLLYYHYNSSDGNKPEMEGVIFAVKQEPDKIIETIKKYFITKQFTVIKNKTQRIELKKDSQEVSVYYHYYEETDFYKFEIILY